LVAIAPALVERRKNFPLRARVCYSLGLASKSVRAT
jgi:hypothetical protein